MKKIVTSLTLILLLTSLYAAIPDTEVRIAPYQGAFGVPLSSDKYQYTYTDSKFNWKKHGFDSYSYNNQQMIALLGAYYIPIEPKDELNQYTLDIEATCAGGFYFTSQSNPAFKRPFQLLFIVKEQLSIGEQHDSAAEVIMAKKVIGEGDNATTSISQTFDSSKLNFKPSHNSAGIKCDVVLVLPYDVKDGVKGINLSNDTITWNNQIYTLTEAEDYIAQVQFHVTLRKDNAIVDSYSISVPFSGYYRKDAKPDTLLTNSICNMYVTPSASAARIDINSAVTTGDLIHVGDINMWMGLTNVKKVDGGYTVNGIKYDPEAQGPKIFASAYRDPQAEVSTASNGFMLVHDSILSNNLLTDTNSVAFTVRFTDEKGNSKDFNGRSNYDYYKNQGHSSEWITSPFEAIPYNPPGGGQSKDYFYFHYSGSIYVILERKDNTIMFPGRYTGNIYIHLVTGE